MENIIKTAAGIAGGIASYLWGGWSVALETLLVFVALDYATGVIAAVKKGELSSQIGFWGIASKVMIFGVVAVAHMVDQSIGTNNIFRDGAIGFYLANEALSILENAARMGLPIPDSVRKAIYVLKEKDQRKRSPKKGG